MKTKLLTISLVLLFCSTVFAQREQNKIGYVDMDYILNELPDFKEANSELNQKIEKWKGEIELKQEKIRGLKEDLENERPLLTQDLIDERQDEIDYYQKQLQEYQQKRFGPEGDMIAQRRQIMQPIQDEVFNAVQEIGDNREYDFIYDNSSDALMLYAAKRHDISDQILAGIRRNSRKLTGSQKEESSVNEEEYKSVKQARLDEEAEEEREALMREKEEERQAMMDERQRKRDSTRAARQAEFQARRDSIQKQREAQRNNRTQSQNQPKNQEVKEKNSSKTNSTEEETPQKQNAVEEKSSGETLREKQQRQRDAMLKKRQEQRDSIQKVRQQEAEKRKKERDSIIQARNLKNR